jgi:FdhD protein
MNYALIAGGRSKRMAEIGDKSQIPWPPPQGAPLFLHQLEKLQRVAGAGSQDEIFISCRTDQAAVFAEHAKLVHDLNPDRGPLAGLAACLREAAERKAKFLTVLAVDLPLLPVSFLTSLISRSQREGCGVVPRYQDRWEPLVAIYPTAITEEAERRLNDGQLALQDFIDWAIDHDHLLAQPIDKNESGYFHNVNTAADITAAAAQLGSAGLKIEKHSKTDTWEKIETHDEVAAEEPLEIRVEGRSVAVVMRTPGHDEELAAGFLLTEGVAKRREDFFEISQCPSVDSDSPESSRGNVIDVLLGSEAKARDPNLEQLTRHVFTSSSCGICGKATIDSVFQSFPTLASDTAPAPLLDRELLIDLPHRLRKAQKNFRRTGGLHASALFDASSGELLQVREDVGRHNALDKIIGRAVLDGLTPLANVVLLLSGRISFELMQKALAAGIPIVAGISAPSSLAVEFSRNSGQTLVGFLRDKTFNVYSGGERLH